MTTPTKRKRGRPSKGLTDVPVNVTAPQELADAMRRIAESDGVPLRETWRAAAVEYVARRSEPQPPETTR